ncbi:MAG: hypothetical protein MSC30_06035 [Gaiellaceae bacterium MAG52_C11]|nr:hypothetical protein [Candidatus Gaiellasilicea maunaloa]
MRNPRVADNAVGGTAPDPLRIVFVLYSLGFLRFFDPVVRALVERGHEVHLLCERDYERPSEQRWLAAMRASPLFSYELTHALAGDRWAPIGRFLRSAADLAYFSSPAFRGKRSLVQRAGRRAPTLFRRLTEGPFLRSERLRILLWRTLTGLERALPVAQPLELELRRKSPDVLVVSPFLMPGMRHSEYVRTARHLGIPSCMCIASWDNLSNKAHLRDPADRLVVWNGVQRREAMELHGVPEERIAITGAQSFDIWFDWTPRAREEFCPHVGLDPERGYLMYVGGSLYRGKMTEAAYVHDVWIPEIRRDPRLADLGLLLRPHPYRMTQWAEQDWSSWRDVVLWPRNQDEMPVDEEARADYFDSIFHSEAVVGINTSAMIESAIVGRAVHTILAPEFEGSQTGTFHFDYLREVGGGVLATAHTYAEHRDQLLATLAGNDAEAETRRRRFLEEFVRPLGLERPAVPAVIETIETIARHGPIATEPQGLGLFPMRALLYGALGLTTVLGPVVTPFANAKRRRRLLERLRRLPRGAFRRGRRLAYSGRSSRHSSIRRAHRLARLAVRIGNRGWQR